jgi:beta-glucosidase/6-phospho-beta-glucosidase/beta-galactosidase
MVRAHCGFGGWCGHASFKRFTRALMFHDFCHNGFARRVKRFTVFNDILLGFFISIQYTVHVWHHFIHE